MGLVTEAKKIIDTMEQILPILLILSSQANNMIACSTAHMRVKKQELNDSTYSALPQVGPASFSHFCTFNVELIWGILTWYILRVH